MKQRILERIKQLFIFWLARRLPNCKSVTPKFGESLDRELSIKTKLTLRLHLLTCEACSRYFRQIKYLSETMHVQEERLTRDDESTSQRLSVDARDRLKKRMQLQMAVGDSF